MIFVKGIPRECECGASLFTFEQLAKWTGFVEVKHGCCGDQTLWQYRMITRGQPV